MKGRWAPADDGACADLFEAAQEITASAGLPAYEISNHAAPGHRSRHNQTYWRQDDYLGVGPGAHGRVTISGARHATETALAPDAYLARVEKDGCGMTVDEELSTEDARIEKFAMGLRTIDGVEATAADLAAFGVRAETLIAEGFLRRDGARLAAHRGRPTSSSTPCWPGSSPDGD